MHDGKVVELMEYVRTKRWKFLANIYTDFLRGERIPTEWGSGHIILVYEKGSKENIRNYQPISLLAFSEI